MLPRHQNELMLRLERAIDIGWAAIEWSELYRWYGAARINKNVWRDLRDRLAEIAERVTFSIVEHQNAGICIVREDMARTLEDVAK